MANSTAFDWLAEALESATSLDRLAARGTLRITLKSVGLEPASVTSHDLEVVLDRVMPAELEARGVDDAASLCGELAARMRAAVDDTGPAVSPADIFARLG